MSITTTRPQSDRDILRNQLTKMSGEFKAALPAHITPDKFARVVLTAVQQNPDLMMADRRSLLMSATKCAQDGLVPDGREAAFVIFKTKIKTKKQRPDGSFYDVEDWANLCQYLPMVAGILKRVRNGGVVSSLEAHVIHANDRFVWKQGTDSALEHEPLFPGERGEMIGAYAVARFKDGSPPVFRVMDRARIEKARNVSRAKNGPLWTQWTDEAWQKTVIRNLAKYLPADAEIEHVAVRDDTPPDAEETTTTIDGVLTDDQRQAPHSPRLDALEGVIDGEFIDNDPDMGGP